MKLGWVKGFIVDLDGVLYTGNTPISGALETILYLRERGRKVRFVTNKSDESRGEYARKLSEMGVRCGEDEVIPSSYGVALYLKEKYGKGRCFVIGGRGMVEELREGGFEVVSGREGEKASFVVVGIDRELTYEKLKIGMRALMNGARFVAANPDLLKPDEDGPVPGAGAIVAALEACSGVKPVVVGKPNRMLFEMAVESMGMRKKEVAVVGDVVDTDIVGGNRLGLYTILVLSGVTKKGQVRGLRGERKPKLVLNSIAELKELL